MWPWIVAGAAGAAVLLYKVVASASEEPPKPAPAKPPMPLNVKPPPKAVPAAPSHGTAIPHTVPGGAFVYTGAQAAPADVQAAANALAAVDPTQKSSEQLVRNFQDTAGLAQRPGGAGWDSVQPTGTDGRYGHDVRAVLGKYVSNPPPASATRPTWWGAPGGYRNN